MWTLALCALPVTVPTLLRCWLRRPLTPTDRRLAVVDAQLDA